MSDKIVQILAEHVVASHNGHFVCTAEGCPWESKITGSIRDTFNPAYGPRVAFAEHLADELQEVLAVVWDEGADAALEHWSSRPYDPEDRPPNPYVKERDKGPTCPRCVNVPLLWSSWGYRCPECLTFVTMAKQD